MNNTEGIKALVAKWRLVLLHIAQEKSVGEGEYWSGMPDDRLASQLQKRINGYSAMAQDALDAEPDADELESLTAVAGDAEPALWLVKLRGLAGELLREHAYHSEADANQSLTQLANCVGFTATVTPYYATPTRQAVEGMVQARAVIELSRDALAEELSAWDIDPPLAHVKEAHDKCEEWLAAAAPQAGKGDGNA